MYAISESCIPKMKDDSEEGDVSTVVSPVSVRPAPITLCNFGALKNKE